MKKIILFLLLFLAYTASAQVKVKSYTADEIVFTQSLQYAIDDNRTSFKIYPNPATDFLNIEGNTGEVIIYDILGNEVLRSEGSRIDIRGLSSGVCRVNWKMMLKGE